MGIPICQGGAQLACADADDVPSIKNAGKDITTRNNHFCFIEILRTGYPFLGTALTIGCAASNEAIQQRWTKSLRSLLATGN